MYTVQENTFIIEAYFRSGRLVNEEWQYSIPECKAQFRLKFPNKIVEETALQHHVRQIIERFQTTGSVLKGKSTGRLQTNQNVTEQVQALVEENPHSSLRRLSARTDVSYSTVRRILKKRLHMHPYKITLVQKILPRDHNSRMQYCNFFQENLNNDDVLDLSFFSDEAWFYLSGYVNKQNYRTWSVVNPHNIIEVPLHPVKVGIWLAVSRRRIIGPIFFHNTINGQRYRQQLLEPFLEQVHPEEFEGGFFQQDGATAHTTQQNLGFLEEFFPGRVVSRGTWPARSPDLNALDFSIFGYIKDQVYKERINNLEELMERITLICDEITPDTLQHIFNNMKRRVLLCMQQNGGHFEHLL